MSSSQYCVFSASFVDRHADWDAFQFLGCVLSIGEWASVSSIVAVYSVSIGGWPLEFATIASNAGLHIRSMLSMTMWKMTKNKPRFLIESRYCPPTYICVDREILSKMCQEKSCWSVRTLYPHISSGSPFSTHSVRVSASHTSSAWTPYTTKTQILT